MLRGIKGVLRERTQVGMCGDCRIPRAEAEQVAQVSRAGSF